jgi:hypothetical protein
MYLLIYYDGRCDTHTHRRFHECLTGGAESSFAIEKDTFCAVCKAHGLVQLVDIRALEQQELTVTQWKSATGTLKR